MARSATPTIALVAGETSGDFLGGQLLHRLRERIPGVSYFGIGGPRMEHAGMQVAFPMEKLAVRGYVEVLRHYREIRSIRSRLTRQILRQPPDLFVGIDAPDFNLDMERRIKASGVPVVHYVSPSVWAWRAWRLNRITRSVSHMLVLFPFEEALYRSRGVPVTYVGHPLADVIPEVVDRVAVRDQLRVPNDRRVVALLPGSRQSELRYLAETYIATARIMYAESPDCVFLVPLATRETHGIFIQTMTRLDAHSLPITPMFGHAREALSAADVALVASGTATLEAALCKTPMVITYRMAATSWALMRRMAYLPYVGLPNILCGEFVVPELLQEHATPINLAQALLNLLYDRETAGRLARRFTALHRELRCDASARASEAIEHLLR